MHADIKELEYNYIDHGIYIGTNQCCITHFDEVLQQEGISGILSLEGERIDQPQGVDYFVWVPVVDHTAPTQDQLKFGVDALDSWVKMGKRVYAHCKNGHGRAPTMVAAYLIAHGKTVEGAIEFIKEHRPSIHLDDVQVDALKEFAQG